MSTHDNAVNQTASLQSVEHARLFDAIDSLRSFGVDEHVALPQLVVCGDQSSGKSSVLEAIAGVNFPTKDTLCTRFATEVVCRRAPAIEVTVYIRPSEDRTEEDRQKLRSFSFPQPTLAKTSEIVESAKQTMGLTEDASSFSHDILHIEVSGPKQANLTLVDLPGLIHSGESEQDEQLVQDLVEAYMKASRSIILAVVTAKSDLALQLVTKLAKKHDPRSTRTLGIITKPDVLHPGSESEQAYLKLSKNEVLSLRLGWHVLRNRDWPNRNCSSEDRDKMEKLFFAKGAWNTLRVNSVGVQSLRPRLSVVLKDHILKEVPALLLEVKNQITTTHNRLERLGASRSTLHEQRQYLINASQNFSKLLKAASDGMYNHEFFGDASTELGYRRRLRAVMRFQLTAFERHIRRAGHTYVIVSDSQNDPLEDNQVRRSDMINRVLDLMIRTRGRELPGLFNPLIVGDLFYEQSKPWTRLVHDSKNEVVKSGEDCIELILQHVTDEISAKGIHQHVLSPTMLAIGQNLSASLKAIMRPHQQGHPITLNHYFTESIQKARLAHTEKELTARIAKFFSLKENEEVRSVFRPRDLANWLSSGTNADMDEFSCSEAIYCMEAYYKVAMKVVIDSFAAQAIENSFLEPLIEIFNPQVVMQLSDDIVRDIASESDQSKAERSQLEQKAKSLERGLQTLRTLSQHSPGRFEEELAKSNSSRAEWLKRIQVFPTEPEEQPPSLNNPSLMDGRLGFQQDHEIDEYESGVREQPEEPSRTLDFSWGFSSSESRRVAKKKARRRAKVANSDDTISS